MLRQKATTSNRHNMSCTPSIPELIVKKRDGGRLSRDDIEVFIQAVVSRSIQDSQLGQFKQLLLLSFRFHLVIVLSRFCVIKGKL